MSARPPNGQEGRTRRKRLIPREMMRSEEGRKELKKFAHFGSGACWFQAINSARTCRTRPVIHSQLGAQWSATARRTTRLDPLCQEYSQTAGRCSVPIGARPAGAAPSWFPSDCLDIAVPPFVEGRLPPRAQDHQMGKRAASVVSDSIHRRWGDSRKTRKGGLNPPIRVRCSLVSRVSGSPSWLLLCRRADSSPERNTFKWERSEIWRNLHKEKEIGRSEVEGSVKFNFTILPTGHS